MSLIYRSYYYGLPQDQIAALEAVTQATVDRMFTLTEALLQLLPDEHTKSFGDADYGMQKKPNNIILYRDHSAGWWAVLQVDRPFQDDTWASPNYQDRVSFRIFARQGEMPKWVQTGKFEANERDQNNAKWKRLETDFLYDRADLFFRALKDTSDKGWSCPLHLINFQHPLLMNLQHAVDALTGKESV